MDLDLNDILWEDEDILVIRKHAGTPVQHVGIGKMDLEHLLLNYLAIGNTEKRRTPYLAVIHRLVEGILMFAKNRDSAKKLNDQMVKNQIKKDYLAVAENAPKILEGTLRDYLLKKKSSNKSEVVTKNTPGAKRAILSYQMLTGDDQSGRALLSISLKTGRHHQIRVQMSHADMPLCGDRKYNEDYIDGEQLALCAYKLKFFHPVTNQELKFQINPENVIFRPFLEELKRQ